MESWKKVLAKIVAALAVLAAAIYGGDYIVLRVRIAKNWNAFGTVEVDRYYSIAEQSHGVYPHRHATGNLRALAFSSHGR